MKLENLHGNTIWCEPASGSLVLKPTKIILSSHILKLGVAFECVDYTFPFYGVSALHIKVVRQEKLLRPMKLSPPSDGLLWLVIPTNSNLNVVTVISFDLLYTSYVWRPIRVRWSHQQTLPG